MAKDHQMLGNIQSAEGDVIAALYKEFQDKGIALDMSAKRTIRSYVTMYGKKNGKESISEITFDSACGDLANDIPALMDYLDSQEEDFLSSGEKETVEEASEEEPAAAETEPEAEEEAPAKKAPEKKGKLTQSAALNDMFSSFNPKKSTLDNTSYAEIKRKINVLKMKRDYDHRNLTLFREDLSIMNSIVNYCKNNPEKGNYRGHDFCYYKGIIHCALSLLLNELKKDGENDLLNAATKGYEENQKVKEKLNKEIQTLRDKY